MGLIGLILMVLSDRFAINHLFRADSCLIRELIFVVEKSFIIPCFQKAYKNRRYRYQHAPFPIVERNNAPRCRQGGYLGAETRSVSSLKFPFMPFAVCCIVLVLLRDLRVKLPGLPQYLSGFQRNRNTIVVRYHPRRIVCRRPGR